MECDKCGALLESYGVKLFSDKDEAEETAYWEGWEVTDDCQCYCPDCSRAKFLKIEEQ